MPQTTIQDYQDTPALRGELLDFLNRTGKPPTETCTWEARLRHWWDENPHAQLHPLRGYILRHEERIVGYAGAIPTSHSIQGQRFPTVCATTLRVDPEHRKGAVQILLKMRALATEVIVTHTTAIPKLRETLAHMGARAEVQVKRFLFPTGRQASFLRMHDSWPQLGPHLRLTQNLDAVKSIAPLSRTQDKIEKWICPESLRWQMSTPMYAFNFMGAVDADGALHAFLILQNRPRTFRLLQAWDVVEAWTAHEHPDQIHALLGCLVRRPSLLSPNLNWLTAATFPGDPTWTAAPHLISRKQTVCHYFMLPEALRDLPKHTVMAEGDLVL
ncbi:MAG: hypothetical protein NTV80_01620 [Verrucomicrobia bacterium]|nr:hypothetical protein [Verrucomicrobiota bacterium]